MFLKVNILYRAIRQRLRAGNAKSRRGPRSRTIFPEEAEPEPEPEPARQEQPGPEQLRAPSPPARASLTLAENLADP